MGAPIVTSLRRVTRLPLEAHLMIANPDACVEEFAEAGTDSFLVHWEGNNDLSRTVQRIKALGKRVGVAINPATSAAVLEEIMQDIDQVLVMTVNPGFGGQKFIEPVVWKIRHISRLIRERGLDVAIEVDGGVDAHTAPLVVDAGATILVAGSAVFGRSDRKAAMESIRSALSTVTI